MFFFPSSNYIILMLTVNYIYFADFQINKYNTCMSFIDNIIPTNRGMKTQRTIKTKIPLAFERSHNYDWSNRACLVDQQEDGKKGRMLTN